MTPSFELPSGWSVTSSLDTVSLEWASSKNLLYTLEANANARSGTIKLNLDNASTRFTWAGSLNVEVLPEPVLTFVSLEHQNGTSYGTLQGAGTHPSGESMTFTWLLTNEAGADWSPSASLQLASNLFGDCTPVESVGPGDVEPVMCTVLIAANTPPLSEPSFTLVLSDGGVELTTTVGMLVAANEQVAWDVGNVPQFVTGEMRQLTVEVTNTGNTALQRQVVLDVPETWTASVDGNDIVNLEVGESALVRLNVRADLPGSATLGIALSQTTANDARYDLVLLAEGEPVGTSGESGLNTATTVVLIAFMLLAAFGFIGMQMIRGRKESMTPVASAPLPSMALAPSPEPQSMQPTAPPAGMPPASKDAPARQTSTPETVNITYNIVQNVQDSVIQGNVGMNSEAPVCWTCRQPITTSAVGCPSCGALPRRRDRRLHCRCGCRMRELPSTLIDLPSGLSNEPS